MKTISVTIPDELYSKLETAAIEEAESGADIAKEIENEILFLVRHCLVALEHDEKHPRQLTERETCSVCDGVHEMILGLKSAVQRARSRNEIILSDEETQKIFAIIDSFNPPYVTTVSRNALLNFVKKKNEGMS